MTNPAEPDTPRTNAEHESSPDNGPVSPQCYGRMIALARQMERELSQAQATIAALRRELPPPSGNATFRIFKPCEKHKDVTSWTVHPSGYAIPATEVCPVCEEIAYNQQLAAAEAEGKELKGGKSP